VEYVLEIGIQLQAVESGDGMYTTRSYAQAAGTYVEVEGVGVCQFDPTTRPDKTTLNSGQPEQEWENAGDWQFTLPVTGRPVVLLAVGGGNQAFDHWEGEPACRDQGARCELAEPEGQEVGVPRPSNLIRPGVLPDMSVTAVFRFAEPPPVSEVHEFEEGDHQRNRSRVIRPPRP
jgi:hypothetical protein